LLSWSQQLGLEDAQWPSPCQLAARLKTFKPDGTHPDLPGATTLFHNDRHGHFTDVTKAWGLTFRARLPFTPDFADFDGDGRVDLALTGDMCTSRLYRNVDGTHFEDVTAKAGVATDQNGMGSVVADLDGDGRPDWFVTGVGYPTADGE